jgi:hypothetical protein
MEGTVLFDTADTFNSAENVLITHGISGFVEPRTDRDAAYRKKYSLYFQDEIPVLPDYSLIINVS